MCELQLIWQDVYNRMPNIVVLQVNSEFYTGWLDHWGDKHAQVDTLKVSKMLGDMLSMGANVNMWVTP